MSDYHNDSAPIGVLLVNLGTPTAPTPKAVGRYLREFLWDPRLTDIPRPLWWLILNAVIVPTRSRYSARNYQKIWTEAGSPLLVNSQRQSAGVQALLSAELKRPVCVELGMRYGEPSITSALQKLREQRVRELVVLPLYPQYSATTSGSVFDAVTHELQTWRWVPTLRIVTEYAAEPTYIEALATSIIRHRSAQTPSELLLFSFHGLPKRSLPEGDPYYCFCHKTARLVAERLGLKQEQWRVVFQS
ncbi:MAG: ferrochelatase, partial [Pseudomonadota bacterium]|nr:ferrochelatase [Pseudomonadota bacterium]